MAKRGRPHSPQTLDAVQILGQQIAQARRARQWTSQELAERIGVSPRTVSSLEHGAPTVAIGIVLEAATVLGVPLFGADGAELAQLARQGRERLALLPSRVYARSEPVHDDF